MQIDCRNTGCLPSKRISLWLQCSVEQRRHTTKGTHPDAGAAKCLIAEAVNGFNANVMQNQLGAAEIDSICPNGLLYKMTSH